MGAVIEDGAGRILLVKHVPERGGYWQDKWICPGGRLEPEETIEEGIRREAKEETNLEIELVKPLPAFDTIFREDDGTFLHVIYIDYLARVAKGHFVPGSEIREAVWVEKERITTIWEELHDDTKRLLKIAGVVEPKGVNCAP